MHKQPKVEPQLLSERDAAKWLATSPRTLWGLRSKGKIPVVRVGRLIRYDVDDLRNFVAANKTGCDHV
ncbi:helix-turn-helix domain-containing protein [Novipirellula maiorica]|uniref:helix-turn-helix domain-containing protein n=1 Tax=Novipirellula maiorica TaxID=1265734 RepID=UPI0005942FBE